MITKKCLICEKEFIVGNYRKDTAKFCSYNCVNKYKKIESAQREFPKKRKDRIDRRWKTNHGYIVMYRPTHPLANKKGNIKEHRFLFEEYLINNYPNHLALIIINNTLCLNPKYIIHHINGIRDDNRIENLQVLSFKEHCKLSNLGQFGLSNNAKHRWKGSHKVKKICQNCNKTFSLYRSIAMQWKGSGKYCSNQCKWKK